MKRMTKRQAHEEAHRRWGTSGAAVGDRYGITFAGHKSRGAGRFSVGYAVRCTGGGVRGVTMGVGATWEDAFADADRHPERAPLKEEQ